MKILNKNRSIALLVAGAVILFCLLIARPLIRSFNSEDVPPTPLSDIVLQLEDLNPELFEQDGQSRQCDKYLFIEPLQNDVTQTPVDCYQVKFSTLDDSVILLNAIWLFDTPVKAELEINRFAELIPAADNLDMNIVAFPVPLGDKNTASTAIVTGGTSPLHVTNLYWKHESAVVRLSVLRYQAPVPLEEVMMPAQRIEARLASR